MSFSEPVSIPHYQFPVSLDPVNGVQTVQQGLAGEIQANLLSILACGIGDCPEMPTFGVPDTTFQQQPADETAVIAALQRLEPRATVEQIVSAVNAAQGSWTVQLNATVSTDQ